MTITIKQYRLALAEAIEASDRDAYVSELALSDVWEDAEDTVEIPAERVELLGEIYDAVHRTVRDIAADAKLSQRKLAERFGIPYRTVEEWCAGRRECTVYTRLMMQECLGLLHI